MAYEPSFDDLPLIDNGYNPSVQDIPNEKNKISNIKKFLSEIIPQPSMPIGINIASGLFSLAGRSPEEKDIIRNIPQAFSKKEAGLPEKFAQGIGEYLPLSLTGIGSVRGLPGIAARIGSTSGYGAAINPEDRLKGAMEGAEIGTLGEVIPSIFKGLSSIAESVKPIGFSKQKISDIYNNYKKTQIKQKNAYAPVIEKYGDYPVTFTPKEYLNFSKKNLSYDSKDLYDNFLNEPTFNNLHKLQSQIYKDSLAFKKNPNRINSYQKSKKARDHLVKKINNFLSIDQNAKNLYSEGSRITREEIKPFLETPELRKIVKGKITEREPKQLRNLISKALEKEHSNIPNNHYLRKVKNELDSKLEKSDITEQVLPESLRKWSPKFDKLFQNEKLVDLLQAIDKGIYQPIKMSAIGKSLER